MAKSEQHRVGALERISSTRALVRGREVVWFAGCDYLGLAHHPAVVGALVAEARRHGISASASPTTTGTSPAHVELEQRLARFLEVEAALLVADGYLSNLVALQALAPELDGVLVERGSHASVHDAARATGLALEEFDDAWTRDTARRALITDGLFPAAGRIAPLGEHARLLDAGLAALVVDDCHGLGVLGAGGRGTCEHFGVRHARLVITGTLSKVLGAFGGFVAGSAELVRAAREHARAYAGATPIPPAVARAAIAAIDTVESEPERRARLAANVERMRPVFARRGRHATPFVNPVATIALTDPAAMQRAHGELLDSGLLVPFVNYPDGLGGYLRIALSSEHTDAELDQLAAGLDRAIPAR